MNETHEHLIRQENALEFILGGNALFTVRSTRTGTRYTYKVLVNRQDSSLLKVYLMNGSDNTTSFKMVGTIELINGMGEFKPLSIHTKNSPSVVAFDHIFLNLSIKYPMPNLEIWHNGRCCRCGRILTVPESIINGIGPECAFKESRVAR